MTGVSVGVFSLILVSHLAYIYWPCCFFSGFLLDNLF